MKIAETTEGQLDYAANELLNRSTNQDPPKYRLQAPATSLSKGTLSWDTQRQDRRHEEIAFIQGKQDERVRADLYNFTGEVDVFVRHFVPGTPDDKQMVRVLTLRHDVIIAHVPLTVVGGAPGAAGVSSRFFSPNGQWLWNYQDDGAVVCYDTHQSKDESTWTPQWAIRRTGQIDRLVS